MRKVIKIPSVPVVADSGLQNFLTAIKQSVEQSNSVVPTPQAVSGLTATPIAGGIVVQFVRSNAANFRLFYNTTANQKSASIVDLGSNNRYTDNVGQGGETRYYWVQAQNANAASDSLIVGPVSATSLALTATASVPKPTQQSYAMVFDTTINGYRPAIYGTDYVTPGKQAPVE
jgi:hypothetical protein